MTKALKVAVVAFTRDGALMGSHIAGVLNGRIFVPERYAGDGREALSVSVGEWATEWFDREKADALVFISAAGIAVRAIAPHIRDKTTDPAVIVLDDAGRNVISLLSGHIGGGNDVARKIAVLTGGHAVVTTATDVHGLEAVDEWAVRNDCAIENVAAVKDVSARMLDNLPVGIAITDMLVSPPWPVTLWLRPRVLVLGAGCKRNTPKPALDAAVEDFLEGAGVSPLALKAVASIDLKRDEPALIDFCRERGLPFQTFSAGELEEAEGPFSSSEKVRKVTGVDNVCERAAVLGAAGGPLLRSKTLYPGIALALARVTGIPALSGKEGTLP